MFEGKDVKVLLANAGTGKTHRLIKEVSKELETRRPEEIAFVTFTRKGAEEGLNRVCSKLMLEPEELPYFRTLHSLTFHALNYKANQMFGRIDQRKFNKLYGYNINRSEVDTGKVAPTRDSQYLDFYDLERSGALTSKQLVEADIEKGYYHQLVQNYEEYKAQQHLVDFFDCLIKYVQEGDSLPCKVVMIDECFSPETRVRMGDMSVKEIKDIKVGDYVMGVNGATKVTAVHIGIDTMYDVMSLKNEKIFTCNSKHLIKQYTGYIVDEWKPAETLTTDDMGVYVERLLYSDLKTKAMWGKVQVVCTNKKGQYVGITVEAEDHLFLLANGAVVHNCQDITALQWRVIEKAFRNAEKITIAGDDKQCQPLGSKVLTREGYKNIEDLTEKDCLITFSQENYSYYGKRQAEYHPEIVAREYEGTLYDVTVNGTTNRFTPNHRMVVRWFNRDTSLQCVYLMKKGDMYRIGQCQIFSNNGSTHFTTRMNLEGAEAGWILRVCKTKEEALVYEQYYSFMYGIPQLSWSKWYTKEMQRSVYNMLGALEEKAETLLESVHRDINYPMFNHEKAQAKSGGTCISLCEACNLLPEIMKVPVYQGKSKVDKNTIWQSFSVGYEDYKGLVYSLNVPKYHTYVTEGGLTVHNSIYTYSGARPDLLIKLSKQFPVEHLSMSYRIPQSVYHLSVAITNFIGEKTEQESVPRIENGEGSISQLPTLDRLKNFIDTKDYSRNNDVASWYILSRNNCFLEEAQRMLEENLIPYWTADGFFMGGQIMQRLKDYEGFKLEGYGNPKKKENFQRKFGIWDFSVPFTETNLFTEGRKWVYEAYIEKFGLEKLKEMCDWTPQILVSTIHHTKGGEATNVALMLDTTRRTQGNIYESLDEELRILYVGVTRTKENLFLIDSKNGQGYDSIIQAIKEENGLEW